MEQKLYLECYSGISGDMTVGALLDLGADAEKLHSALDSLGLAGCSVTIGRVKKSGLDVCDFAVHTDDGRAELDHDMEYLFGEEDHAHEHGDGHAHEHGDGHAHEHGDGHAHDHGDGHAHDHGDGHTHVHRGLPEIRQIIGDSAMTQAAKETAVRIFEILAQAEAKAHGQTIDEVHFHEVGADDSIMDIAAAAVCLDDLGIKEAIVPVLWEGCGFVRCQHGLLPIPVPATLNIVQAYGLNLHMTDAVGEYVTPTGAAIAAALCSGEKLPERYRVDRIGLGAGKREYERPGILRAMLITPEE